MAWVPAAAAAGAAVYGAVKGNDTPTPDYSATAGQQGVQSQQLAEVQTRLNRPTVNTPWGSQSWTENQISNPEYEALMQAKDQGRVADWGAWEKAVASTPKTLGSEWTQNINLSPEQQAIYNEQSKTQLGRQQLANNLLPQAQSALANGIDWSSLPSAGQSLQGRQLATQLDFSGAPQLEDVGDIRNKAEQALYERSTSRLDPQWTQQEDAMRTRLYNQGLREGDAAYDSAMRDFGNQKTDAYQAAMNEAISAGGTEASRQYQMQLGARQQGVSEATSMADFMNQAAAQGLSQDQAISAYQNQLRQQALSEQQTGRNQAINEMNALQSGQQVSMPTFPGFQAASAGQTPNLLGAAQAQYGADVNSYNAGQAQTNNLLQGIAGLIPYLYGSGSSGTPYTYG